jgi:hypothetical protein
VVVTPLDDEAADDSGADGAGAGRRELEVAVSWNGATEVATWRVLAGEDADDLTPVAEVGKDGFETRTRIERAPVVAVEALDATGQVLDRSETVAIER